MSETQTLGSVPRRIRSRHSVDYAAYALYLGIALLLLWHYWGVWADPIIDFGRELYTPWRLSEGEVLGRDIAWFNGPLSQYFNAGLFAVFGVSLRTLVLANFAIVLAVSVLLDALLRNFASRTAAIAGTVSFLVLCAFVQLEGVANFNWLCPYSHEITHGVFLGLLSTYALQRWLRNERRGMLVLGAVALGLCFLTKPETFLAAAAAALTAWLIRLRSRPVELSSLLLFMLALLLPIISAWLALTSISDSANATSLVLGAWKHVTNTQLSGLLFYRSSLGLDMPGWRLLFVLLWTAFYGALILFAYLLGRLAAASRLRTQILAGLGAAIIFFPVLAQAATEELERWFQVAFTPMLPVVLALFLGAAKRVFIARKTDNSLVFIVFALVVLAKLGIYARIHHYGFALGAAALALSTAAMLEYLPRFLARHGASVLVTRAVFLGLLATLLTTGLRLSERHRNEKSVVMGYGSDVFRAGENAVFHNMMLDTLRKTDKDTRLLVWPEGIMFNYLARRRTATRVLNFMPPELIMFGEGTILAELESSPPDLVLVQTRLAIEYGLPLFGHDYARRLVAWLRKEYEVLATPSIGPDPLDEARIKDRSLGWRIYRRRSR